MCYALLVKKARYVLAVLLVVVTSWMAYDNVLADVAPTQKLAEDAACAVKKCDEKHALTRMERNPLGQHFDYQWKDRTVTLWCHRDFYVVGTRKCTVE